MPVDDSTLAPVLRAVLPLGDVSVDASTGPSADAICVSEIQEAASSQAACRTLDRPDFPARPKLFAHWQMEMNFGGHFSDLPTIRPCEFTVGKYCGVLRRNPRRQRFPWERQACNRRATNYRGDCGNCSLSTRQCGLKAFSNSCAPVKRKQSLSSLIKPRFHSIRILLAGSTAMWPTGFFQA